MQQQPNNNQLIHNTTTIPEIQLKCDSTYANSCGTIWSKTPNLNICQVIEVFQQGISLQLQRGAIKANLINAMYATL